MTTKCRIPGCGSYSINPGRYGRPEHKENIDHDLCDVHFWKIRYDNLALAWGQIRVPLRNASLALDKAQEWFLPVK